MNNEERVRASFLEQAAYCERLGSAFMRDLLTGLAQYLDHVTLTGRHVLNWPGNPEPKDDALALRLAGALHDLARSGKAPSLSYFYANPQNSSERDFIPAVIDAIHAFDDHLVPWLQFAPQTNEVARSSIIFPGFCVLADRFRLPLSLHEIGCSAGLNLQCAEFGFQFGDTFFGNPRSSLVLKPDWTGSLPPASPVIVSGRKGCDLNPLCVSDQNDAAKLLAYLWPDQPFRIERMKTATGIARSNPPKLEKAAADEWVEKTISAGLEPGNVTVLYNTIAWNYFPQRTRSRIAAHVHAVGTRASSDNPLAWLAFEFDARDEGPFLTLQTWPGSGDKTILASADAHVRSIYWVK